MSSSPKSGPLILLIVANFLVGFSLRAVALDPAPEDSFSIAVLPDTHGYHGKGTVADKGSTAPTTNPVFENHIKFILDHLKDQRIAFVSHLGDIVDQKSPEQMALAKELIGRLRGQVPFGLTVGNHDMKPSGNSLEFQKMFPASSFKEYPWYGGCFPGDPAQPGISGNNANSYQLFSAAGRDFLILHLECNAPDNVLQWADAIMDKYPDRLALISTHMDLGPLYGENGAGKNPEIGRMQWKKTHGNLGNTPQQMWDKCFRKHANLRVIFSGDQRRAGYAHLESVGDHGNKVQAFLSDYYSAGPMRLYRFTPSKNQLRVITYDTSKQALVASATFGGPSPGAGILTYDPPESPPIETPERATQQYTVDLDLKRP